MKITVTMTDLTENEAGAMNKAFTDFCTATYPDRQWAVSVTPDDYPPAQADVAPPQ